MPTLNDEKGRLRGWFALLTASFLIPTGAFGADSPRDHGEFMLRRLSQAARNAGVPLAPEKCKANFLVLVTSEPDQLLQDLRRKKPGLFDVQHGLGALKRFLRTERPVRVRYNWQNLGDDDSLATAGSFTGTNSPSAAGAGLPTARLPNSRLTYSVAKSISTAIIAVDLPRMKGVNLGQLCDYVAMMLLKSLYASRATDVMQISAMETQMVDSILRH